MSLASQPSSLLLMSPEDNCLIARTALACGDGAIHV